VNPHRIEYAEASGFADTVFDGRHEKVRRRFKEASGGGFDKVVETSAVDAGLALGVSALRARGTLVLAGINFSPQAVPTLAMTSKELVQKGSMAYSIGEFDTALAFIADKRLDVGGMVNKRAKLSDLQDIFEKLHSGEPTIVKAVIFPSDRP